MARSKATWSGPFCNRQRDRNSERENFRKRKGVSGFVLTNPDIKKRMSTPNTAMEVPAKLVKELRDRTNAGFNDCRAALAEAGLDIEKAIAILRKKGQAAAAKKATREATE